MINSSQDPTVRQARAALKSTFPRRRRNSDLPPAIMLLVFSGVQVACAFTGGSLCKPIGEILRILAQ